MSVFCERCRRPLVQGRCETCATDAESYRSSQGRILFVPPPLAAWGFLPPDPKPVVSRRDLELEQLLVHAADSIEDEQALLVASDALMERGDPRGRLIAFMLEEEKQSELHRKVKINVLIRDHAAGWAPPGARITSFRRGLPDALEWTGGTDPKHHAWRSARSIHVEVTRVPARSVFNEPRPRLRRVTGLSRTFFSHVAALAPENLEVLDGSVDTDDLPALSLPLERMPRLRTLTVRTARFLYDARLTAAQVRSFLGSLVGSSLQCVRLTRPLLSLAELQRCVAVAPNLEVLFLLNWVREGEPMVPMTLDVRRRALFAPRGMLAGQEGAVISETLAETLGVVVPVVETDVTSSPGSS